MCLINSDKPLLNADMYKKLSQNGQHGTTTSHRHKLRLILFKNIFTAMRQDKKLFFIFNPQKFDLPQQKVILH